MIVKLFGILDLISAFVFISLNWGIGTSLGIGLALYLIIKSLIFIKAFSSWVDLVTGIYLLLVVFDVHSAFSLIFVLWLGQKAIFSLLVNY
jgi:hypothetical protein